MNSLIFPEGVTYTYKYITGGDFVPVDMTLTNVGNLYKMAQNLVIDVQFDISNITDMTNMFYQCSNLTSIPQLDTSKVTNMTNMFYQCSNLTSIPQLDTSNVISMSGMFSNCNSLTSIPQLDTSKVTNMYAMFQSCSNLTSIPQLDCSKVSDISTFFGYSDIKALTFLGGFKNLGASSSLSGTSSTYVLAKAPNITHESIMNVINNLYDRASAGYSVLTLKLHANTLALLSDDDKAIATNKGWTLS